MVISQVKILQSPDVGAGVLFGEFVLGNLYQISQLKWEAGAPKGTACE